MGASRGKSGPGILQTMGAPPGGRKRFCGPRAVIMRDHSDFLICAIIVSK